MANMTKEESFKYAEARFNSALDDFMKVVRQEAWRPGQKHLGLRKILAEALKDLDNDG